MNIVYQEFFKLFMYLKILTYYIFFYNAYINI